MSSRADWRSSLGATDRYDNIQKIQRLLKAQASSTGVSQKTAFDAETEAYNESDSREAYDEACEGLASEVEADQAEHYELPHFPGTTIGPYTDCHHIASGVVSEVYRAETMALKIITETRDVEPHNPAREVKVLKEVSHPSIISLVETFWDHNNRFVLVFPFKPFSLASIIEFGAVSPPLLVSVFQNLFSALAYLHERGIIHRDVKPSNILMGSRKGPAFLADFGTVWHPILSTSDEPAHHKVLEVGTACYRAPETLFGSRAYGPELDMWAAGVMLAECLRKPPEPLFESRDSSEDGNQLGLILSIFKTLGTPTKETWPEAVNFTTPPFEWYREFPGHSWDELLPDADQPGKMLVAKLLRYESAERLKAAEALDVLIKHASG